jgi:hypothetical protein
MASALVTKLIIQPCETDPIIMYQDMVDTTLFNQTEPRLRADVIVKIVLGSINAILDQVEFPTPY